MPDPVPEWSRPLRLAAIPPAGRDERIAASPAECAALARRFGIPAITRIEARLHLNREPGEAIRARGVLTADVVQECVVTLEPVPQRVEAPIDLRFLPDDRPFSDDPEGPDEIALDGDGLDLGEAVAEQLALALDPYPRAPGAAAAAPQVLPDTEGGEPAGPFARLEALRKPPR